MRYTEYHDGVVVIKDKNLLKRLWRSWRNMRMRKTQKTLKSKI